MDDDDGDEELQEVLRASLAVSSAASGDDEHAGTLILVDIA